MDFWSFLYPRRCPICHGILANNRQIVHPACAADMLPVQEPRCKCCSKPLTRAEEEYCADCKNRPHSFRAGMGIFPYDRIAHTSLSKYKQGGRQEYERYYIKAAVIYGRAFVTRCRPQALAPIPMRPEDRRRRGFFPAGNLARGLGQALEIPVKEELLRKVRKTRPQKTLSYEKRRSNLRHAFAGKPGDWGIRRLLLIDDVYTTGSTMEEAARVAAAHGVEEIYFLTVFIGSGY